MAFSTGNGFTVIESGTFVATGSPEILRFNQQVTKLEVVNLTQIATTQTTGVGVKFEWFAGMAPDSAIEYLKTNSTNALNATVVTSGGITAVDTTNLQTGALHSAATSNGITAISSASIPVATNAGTNGLLPGSVVRIFNEAGAHQLDGYDFTVGYNTLSTTTFSLDYMAQIVAGTTGSFRAVLYDPIFYPPVRLITKIVSSGVNSVITMSVTHKYQVGQEVRIVVPDAFGMVEMNNLIGTIIAIDTTTTTGNTITVDIDSSSFTAFAFPLTAAVPFDPALVVPVGEDVSFAVQNGIDQLSDASRNVGYLGLVLASGAQSPAGQVISSVGDTIRWVAYSSVVDLNSIDTTNDSNY